MVLSETIQPDEKLYRAVKRSRPDVIEGDRISSALFKEAGGISVDRDGTRPEDEIITFMREGILAPRVKAIVRLSADKCFQVGVDVKASPRGENPYHADIYLDQNDERKQSIQALQLADASRIVYVDQEMKWTA